jgi:beta-galactosidase/beta-glucuronidase
MWLKLSKAAIKDVNGAWTMYLPIEFEDIYSMKKMNKNSLRTSPKMK